MLWIKRLVYWLQGAGEWNSQPGATEARRYNFATDQWETRPMSEAEAEESYSWWATR